MKSNLKNFVLVLSFVKTFLRNNPHYTLVWLFMRYARHRLNDLLSRQTQIQSVPDKIHARLLSLVVDKSKKYVGYGACALGKAQGMEGGIATWCIICSKLTQRKYKLLVVPYDCCEVGKIVVSETMRFNLENTLRHPLDEALYFVMSDCEDDAQLAAEARISLICNPVDCPHAMIDCLLKTYFRVPRYLRALDVFRIDVKEYAPDYFYSSAGRNLDKVYFKTNSLRAKRNGLIQATKKACYIVKGETTLVQERNIHSRIPREFVEVIDVESNLSLREQIDMCKVNNYPPSLDKPMEALQACVAPFLDKDIRIKIRPVFLVSGAPGSGKFKLVQSLARRNGLNLLNVDFAEIQSLSAPQTEAKLRIVLQNAKNCVPCILRLSNIQIFGKNSEGQRDERLVSAFAAELDKLNDVQSFDRIVVIATLENDELDANVERLFIETICTKNLGHVQRSDTITWLLQSKGLRYDGDVTKIAGLVADFGLADLDALVTQAATIHHRSASVTTMPVLLAQSNFIEACEQMQAQFSDRVGAPRIPKVHWEDIGGLASLKHEIKRRIELPMLTGMNLGRSGLLLYGPPGTGKTLLAKAVATECQLHFMSVKGPELLNMYVGQSEKNIRQVFERARAAAPCVIFFDELDSLAPKRGRSGDSGGVMDRVVSQLLAEMDGLESAGDVFTIAATNRPDLIDAALLRPGRFDKLLYVGIYSDRDTQLSVLRAVTRRFTMRDAGNELVELVDDLPKNLTGADLQAVCSDAWLIAVRRSLGELENIDDVKIRELRRRTTYKNGVTVELQDFRESTRNLVPSVGDDELSRYERLRAEFSSR